MPRSITNRVMGTNLNGHPAYLAWSKLGRGQEEPQRIEVLQERRDRFPGKGVYRLVGLCPETPVVIAKHWGKASAKLEFTIYDRVLRHLSLPTLQYYGLVCEPESEFCWLFVEDASGQTYSLRNREHRRLAASWLGQMHTTTAGLAQTVPLPDRGATYYRNEMHTAYDTIKESQDSETLTDSHKAILAQILSHCAVLDSRWEYIEDFCGGMPRTLVHGDLVSKNVQLRSTAATLAFLPFDWGTTAGLASPAVDLAQFVGRTVSPDLDVYQEAIDAHWPHLGPTVIRRLAHVGTVFRLVDSIKWESEGLTSRWIDKPIQNMTIYESLLSDWLREAGWG